MNLPPNATLWTLFHKDQLWKRNCSITHESEGEILILPPEFIPESIIDDHLRATGLCIRIPNEHIIERYNLLAITGLIPPSGPRTKIIRLDIRQDDTLIHKMPLFITAPSRCVSKIACGDFEMMAFTALRSSSGQLPITKQQVYLHILALPKGDIRTLIMTFRDRSLEPRYRMIRSVGHEIIIQTADSY